MDSRIVLKVLNPKSFNSKIHSVESCVVLTTRYQEQKSYDIQGPNIVVFETLPNKFEGQRLAIMHSALAGVFSYDPVDHDDLLSITSHY